MKHVRERREGGGDHTRAGEEERGGAVVFPGPVWGFAHFLYRQDEPPDSGGSAKPEVTGLLTGPAPVWSARRVGVF